MPEKTYQLSNARWNQSRFLYEARFDPGYGGKFTISSPFESNKIALNPMEAMRLRQALDEFIQQKTKSALEQRIEGGQMKFYIQQHFLSGWDDAGFKNEAGDTLTFPSVESANGFIDAHIEAVVRLKSGLNHNIPIPERTDFRVAIYEEEE